jgi:tetratricopeptide (TPR) repeat protein
MAEEQFAEACGFLVTGKYEDAAHAFSVMLQSGGDHPMIRYNLALSLECCKKFQDAAREYSTVIREYPEYPLAYMGMANCYFYEGDLEHCEGMLRAVRDADPIDPRAAILLSEVLLMRGFEKEGIVQHLEALDLIDNMGNCFLTHNHAMCYGDFGVGGMGYYSFWETSLLQRGFPDLHSSSPPRGDLVMLLVAHARNAADIARRLQQIPREQVFLVTLDDATATILSEYEPEMCIGNLVYEPHELPSLQLHIGNHVVSHVGVTVLLPADDGGSDAAKLAWAVEKECAVSKNGDLVTNRAVDARRVPPLLHKGQHAAPDTFVKVFSSLVV